MKILALNTIKYTPLSFKAEATAPVGTYTNTNNSKSDTFEKSTSQEPTNTVNKVITSFKRLFAPNTVGKSKRLSDEEISDLIFSRNSLI